MITSLAIAQPASRRTVGGRAIRSISFDYSLTGYVCRPPMRRGAGISGVDVAWMECVDVARS
jgi:hypothetical protein